MVFVIAMLAVPIVIQVFGASALAYGLNRRLGEAHDDEAAWREIADWFYAHHYDAFLAHQTRAAKGKAER